jgi:hypothetical protein
MSDSCKSCPSAGGSGQGDKGAASALQDELITSTLAKIRYKLFVMSGKGGVGKSSVATNSPRPWQPRATRWACWTWTSTGPAWPGCWA